MLGKRKRKSPERPGISEALENEGQHDQKGDMQAVFRRYFESQFEPLEGDKRYRIAPEKVASHISGGEESEWSGISGGEGGSSGARSTITDMLTRRQMSRSLRS